MAHESPIKILGLSGSLRKGSYNTAALHAAVELAPGGMLVDAYSIADIPLYNEDVRAEGFPPSVQEFRDRIRDADGILIVTPEYNYSIPGVLKNAIDWASRPPDQPFDGKIIAIMGASPSSLGTARAQYHLRQSFVFLNGVVLNRPEVMIMHCESKFDEEGVLIDIPTRRFVTRLMEQLRDKIRDQRTLDNISRQAS